MKRLLPISILSIALLLFSNLVLAQQAIRNNGFDFQGYARNIDGSAVSSQSVQVRFSIFTNGNAQPFGSNAFDELQTLTTDAYGIFTAEIGTDNDDFKALSFENFDYFMKVEVSVGGSNFIEISNKQLKSVPYAQAAGNGVPSGTILPFAGSEDSVPAGFMVCIGQSLDPNDPAYANLFDAIGYNWGRDGNNFRVPELRGWFLRGWNGTTDRDPNADQRFALLDGNTGNAVGSYQLGATALPVAGFTTSSDGAHGHTINKDHETMEPWANFGRNDPVSIRTYNEAGTDFTTSPFNTPTRVNLPNGEPYSALLGETRSAYYTTANGAHTHSISGGDSESRGQNASVLYIIKL